MSRQHLIEEGLKKHKEKNKREAALEVVEKEAWATAKNMVDCLDSPFLREEWPGKPTIWIKNAIMEAVVKYDIAIDVRHNQFLRDRCVPIPKYQIGQEVWFKVADKEYKAVVNRISINIIDKNHVGQVNYDCEGIKGSIAEHMISYVTKECEE